MGSASETEEHDTHEPPVGMDFPLGRSESSWWPIVCAIGATGLYLGAGLYLFGHGEVALVPGFVGPSVIGGGGLVFLIGLFGWLYQAFIADFRTRTEGREPGPLRAAMLLFLGTDVFTFAGGFIYYFFIRAGGWPPGEIPPLLSTVLVVNTALLVVSSFTLHYAHSALEEGNDRRFGFLLVTTLVLGLLFVAGQVYEYHELVVVEGFTITSGIFGSAFYALTGLHGLHVALGTVLLGILVARAHLGQYEPGRDTSIATVSLYWHFVDVVWVFLVVVLYVGASVTPVL
ncbi:cytochrome c oxidase subunit 3 [Halococcus agarilyticus]|uniref:cytochrome c oxidase subunit 3 n=1 Tax=Halococcus agarilyticus TaxID=1232219 RepID=UPI0006776C0E|nr:heme-copper oxidase subunit III [Halococcus agarilyticus]